MVNLRVKIIEHEKSRAKTRIDWIKFYDYTQKIVKYYLEKEYQHGLELSLALKKAFPELPSRTHLFVACFQALLGDKEKAIQTLEEGMTRGGWWTSTYLTSEPDLKSLHDNPRFLEICRKGDEKLEELKVLSRPELEIRLPKKDTEDDSYEVMLILHWRGGNLDETQAFWSPLHDLRPNMILAFLQSSQLQGDHMYCWDDWKVTLQEMQAAFDALKQKMTIKRFILSGSSQGSAVAFKIAFSKILPVNRLILTLPAIKNEEHVMRLLADAETRLPTIPTLILVGKKDHFYQGALELHEFLEARKIPSTLHAWENVGHSFPPEPDFTKAVNDFLNAEY